MLKAFQPVTIIGDSCGIDAHALTVLERVQKFPFVSAIARLVLSLSAEHIILPDTLIKVTIGEFTLTRSMEFSLMPLSNH